MGPDGGGEPSGALGARDQRRFGSLDALKAAVQRRRREALRLRLDAGSSATAPGLAVVLDAEPGLAALERRRAAPRDRRLGARLLPQLPEPPARLPGRLVERRQLGRGRRALAEAHASWSGRASPTYDAGARHRRPGRVGSAIVRAARDATAGPCSPRAAPTATSRGPTRRARSSSARSQELGGLDLLVVRRREGFAPQAVEELDEADWDARLRRDREGQRSSSRRRPRRTCAESRGLRRDVEDVAGVPAVAARSPPHSRGEGRPGDARRACSRARSRPRCASAASRPARSRSSAGQEERRAAETLLGRLGSPATSPRQSLYLARRELRDRARARRRRRPLAQTERRRKP